MIYKIITFRKIPTADEFGWPNFGYSNDVGYYEEENTALTAVAENWGHIDEFGMYPAAVVSAVEPGLYPLGRLRGYFEYDKDNDVYIQKPIPKYLENYNIT